MENNLRTLNQIVIFKALPYLEIRLGNSVVNCKLTR